MIGEKNLNIRTYESGLKTNINRSNYFQQLTNVNLKLATSAII